MTTIKKHGEHKTFPSPTVIFGLIIVIMLIAGGISILLESYWPLVPAAIIAISLLVTVAIKQSSASDQVITISIRYLLQIPLLDKVRSGMEEIDFDELDLRKLLYKVLVFATAFTIVLLSAMYIIPPFIHLLGIEASDFTVIIAVLFVASLLTFLIARGYQALLDQFPNVRMVIDEVKELTITFFIAIFIAILLWWYYKGELVDKIGQFPIPYVNWNGFIQKYTPYNPDWGPMIFLGVALVLTLLGLLRTRAKFSQNLRNSTITIAIAIVLFVTAKMFGMGIIFILLPIFFLFFVFLAIIMIGPGRALQSILGLFVVVVEVILNVFQLLVNVLHQVYRVITEFVGKTIESLKFLDRVFNWFYAPVELLFRYLRAYTKYLNEKIDLMDEADDATKKELLQTAKDALDQSLAESQDRFKSLFYNTDMKD